MDMRDLERVVDRKTKLIAIALVSNVNGYVHDVKKISDLAHAHGAYLYCDVIQAAGGFPSTSTPWGSTFFRAPPTNGSWAAVFGYLYVKKELQGKVLRSKLMGGRTTPAGASRYEISTASHIGCVTQSGALAYILRLGVNRIQEHARPLTARLQAELPAAGYESITPKGNASPIVSFRVPDGAAAKAKLQKADVIATLRVAPNDSQMRVSVSVFNNSEDINQLVQALS
jgi:selenocysteine lyase/cysteine desulfurase